MKRKYAIGTDIGGSHICAVAIDLESGLMLTDSFTSSNLSNKAPADEILGCWGKVLGKTIAFVEKKQLAGIGFAMPGPFEYDKGIARFTHEVDKYESLNGLDIALELQNILGLDNETHFRFMNDATSFAVGEAWKGSAASCKKSVCLTLGTGFGSAFIDSGIPVLEGDNVPHMGCVWHLPFMSGIADDYFSTRWFIKRYAEISGQRMPGVKEIAMKAATDAQARKLFEEYGANIGGFIAPWVKKFGAQCIVIGGNITKSFHLFENMFKSALTAAGATPEIHLSELGETAAMMGSARLMEENFWVRVKPLLSKM
ncbi:MAG: ROK family protein [Bacteroidales bacterium]|nr:ROK family protein [Bacteroidales bacterium]